MIVSDETKQQLAVMKTVYSMLVNSIASVQRLSDEGALCGHVIDDTLLDCMAQLKQYGVMTLDRIEGSQRVAKCS